MNDLGVAMDGEASSGSPAAEVVEEIRDMGGEAVANGDDVSDWEGARRLIAHAVETFGAIDTLVNNAGILRDRMLINMTESDWDAVSRGPLKGTFAPTRWAAVHWRERAKAGETNEGRGPSVCTSSSTGLYGNAGQINYGPAKAGIAAFAHIVALELARVRRDGERHRTHGPHPDERGPAVRTGGHEPLRRGIQPSGVGERVTAGRWSGSDASRDVTGRIFNWACMVATSAWPRDGGPDRVSTKRRVGIPVELSDVIPDLMAKAGPTTDIAGTVPAL